MKYYHYSHFMFQANENIDSVFVLYKFFFYVYSIHYKVITAGIKGSLRPAWLSDTASNR